MQPLYAAFFSASVNGLLWAPACWDLIAVGDSITYGFETTNPWPVNISTALGTSSDNLGVSGIGWNTTVSGNTLTTSAPTLVDPIRTTFGDCAPKLPYLVLFAGTNDIFNSGYTGTQTYGYFQTYISARLSAGWLPHQIVVATMLPRGSSDTDRTTYNADLVNGATTYGYALARLDLDSNIGCFGCQSNITYYNSDAIHPNNTGQQIIANLICAAMRPTVSCPAY